MLNATWLQTFITLVDTGHFTKTAEKLFMTQPGVSQHVTKLEKACGYPLLHRDGKRFELSEQGRLVYQHACGLQLAEQQLFEQLGFDDAFCGECKLACSGALALALYPQLLRLQQAHPQLVSHLKAAPNQQILDEIEQGNIDLGIVTAVSKASLFDVLELGQEALYLVLPASFKLSDHIAQDLIELGVINHPDAENYLLHYFSTCQLKGLNQLAFTDIPVRSYVNQLSQILLPVAQGLGFTVLPKSAVDHFPQAEYLQILTAAQPVVETIYCVSRRKRQLPARFSTIKQMLARQLQAAHNDTGHK